MGPNLVTGFFERRGEDTRCGEGRVKAEAGSDAVTSPGAPGGGKAGSCPGAFRAGWLCQHLEFGLPASSPERMNFWILKPLNLE